MKTLKGRNLINVWRLFIFTLLSCSLTNYQFAQNSRQEIFPLPIGKTTERSLKGGESNTYQIKLKKGQVLQINLIEKGTDVQIGILTVDDQKKLKTVNMGFSNNRETITFIAEQTRLFQIEVESIQISSIGGYEFIAKLRTKSNGDEEIDKAERLLTEGFIHANKGTRVGFERGILRWEEALLIWKKVDEKYWEGYTNNVLGQAYSLLGRKQKALEYYNQALSLIKPLKIKKEEIIIINNIGDIFYSLGKKQKALEYFSQSLKLSEEVGGKSEKAKTLNNIGAIYYSLSQNQKSFEYYKQALLLLREVGDKLGEARVLNNFGKIYDRLDEKQKALDYFNQSLALSREIKDKNAETATLNNMGLVYRDLGDNQKALEYFSQSLLLSKQIGNKNVEANIINNIGLVFHSLSEEQKALEYYSQSLSLLISSNAEGQKTSVFNNIGKAYSDLGEREKALKFFEKALQISRIIGDKGGESNILNNIGTIYRLSGKLTESLEYYNQALLLSKKSSDKKREAGILANLMISWELLDNRRLAIFFGQLAVNKFQQLRGSARSPNIDNAIQKSFLSSLKNNYKYLAELLIKQGQAEQAIQVLNLYQDQKFFDFYQYSNSPVRRISLSPRAREFANRYEITSNKFVNISSQVDELKRQIIDGQINELGRKEIKRLETSLKIAMNQFLDVFKEAEKQFSKPLDKKDRVPNVKDISETKSTLKELSKSTNQKTATLYTLIGTEKFYVLFIAESNQVKVFESPISPSDFNRKIIQLYALLQSPQYDSRILGSELYKIIFNRELENELKSKKIETIMWSLDGSLRYIPIGALSPDGKNYLIEKYQNVVFTRVDEESITQSVSPSWTGVGFGSSKSHKIDLFGNGYEIVFSALSGTTEELSSIFQSNGKLSGILIGDVFSDEDFTKATFFKSVKMGYPIIHISSHFRFYPGDSSLSFMVLGDGTALSLSDLREHEKLFEGVELLTLSACDTAAIIPDSEGREIDGFAELAQRLGANSVLATLWQVRDKSTAKLMKEFYENRQMSGLNKADSLRKAQLKLLKENSQIKFYTRINKYIELERKDSLIENTVFRETIKDLSVKDIIVEKKYRVRYKQEGNKPFAHPYYWSPFVLYGNWK